jgi:2-phosphoglycerate kinase
MNKIILIGGAPTVGKTTIARKIAKELNIPWISTDAIRDTMRRIVDKEKYPNLFDTRKFTAEEYLNTFTEQEIVDKEIAQSEDVWKGVKALIDTDYLWDSFIVEGVAILPHLVHRDFSDQKAMKAIFLVDENADRIRDVVFKRGLYTDANLYSDEVKEKEVQWAKLFSSWLRKETEKYGYTFVEVNKGDEDLNCVLQALK